MNKLQIEIGKKLHTREARRVETLLKKKQGILNAAISASGTMLIEWDSELTNQANVVQEIKQLGLKIISLKTNPAHKKHVHNEKQEDHAHGHFDFPVLGENTELYFAIISGVFWISGVVFSFLSGISEWVATTLFIIGAFFGGVFTFLSAGKDLLKGKFEIDFLMLFAAIGAAFLGKWGESALLLFLFSLGHALEHYAMKRAKKSISALSDLAPPKALVKQNGKLREVHIEDLRVGDIIVVRPNSTIAADGVVILGSSPVNQASITGESMPVNKFPSENWQQDEDIQKVLAEHRVFAGTIDR